MRIAVVSDTHGAVMHLRALKEVFDTCDELFFLGDGENDIRLVRSHFTTQTVAVAGNNDFHSSLLKETVEEVSGVRFFLTHGHLYGVRADLNNLYDRAVELNCKFALFGHTHKAVIKEMAGVTLMNPGSLGYPYNSRPSYGIIEGEPERLFAKIVYI